MIWDDKEKDNIWNLGTVPTTERKCSSNWSEHCQLVDVKLSMSESEHIRSGSDIIFCKKTT